MDDRENPTQLQSVGIGDTEKARIVSSMCSEDVSLCSEDNNCYIHAQPIIDVIWRGSFDICNGDGNCEVHGLKAHLSNKACSKVWDAAVKMPKLISAEIVPRLDTWPKGFSESPPTDESIAIYLFPEDESYEEGFNNLLDDIIYGDRALKSVLVNSELLLFTSLQLPMEHRRFQRKIYLWGVFKGKSSPSSYLSNDRPSVPSASVNLAATAVESNATCAEETNEGVSPPTKETNTDSVWEHGKLAGTGKLGVTCNYCNHVFLGKQGIARLKHHLAGGHPKWSIKGCPEVPKEVQEAMKEILRVKMKKQKEIRVSEELKGKKLVDEATTKAKKYWLTASIQGVNQMLEIRKETVVEESSFKEIRTHLCDSDYAVHLMETTVPGSTTSAPQEQGPFGGTRRTRVKTRCKCCVTSETPPKKRNRCILSGAAATLKKKLKEKTSSKRADECENVESEVRHVSEKQKNKVVQKADKGMRRGTKGITGGSSTSILPGKGGNAIDQIQPEVLVEVPVLFVQQNTEIDEGENATDQIHEELPVEDPLLSVQQNPNVPSEEVMEPQIRAPEITPNSASISVIAPTLIVPDVQLEEVSFTPSTVAAQSIGNKANELETTPMPQGDHSGGLSTIYEVSSQSTDQSFLRILDAANELAQSTGTESEHSSVIRVDRYTVKYNLGPTLGAIFEKYGDIASSSPIQSISMRSRFLGELCEVLHQLKDIEFASCNRGHLKSLFDALTSAKSVGLEVSWLDQRCDDLKTALKGIKKYSAMESDLALARGIADSRKESLDLKKADLTRLQFEMQTLNGQLASLRVENGDLESKMSNARLKAKRFRHKNLADGLL